METFIMISEPVNIYLNVSWSSTITTLDTRNRCGQSEVDYYSDLLNHKLRNQPNGLSSLAVPNTGTHPYI